MSTPAKASDQAATDPYLPIEEVAERLDLPLGVLIRRVEAGDVPAQRIEGPDGAHYRVRISDLGLGEPDAPPPQGSDGAAAAVDPAGQRVEVVGSATPSSWPDKVVPPPAEELAAMARSSGAANGSGAPAAPLAPARPRPTSRDVGLVSASPRSEVAGMALDPRELVAGLLDRWERTLEQRIYAEQRQRFETELNARQNLLKQLQLELQTARAEHAAAQADKDRRLAERERRVEDLERELRSAREPVRKRGWFHRG